MAVSATSFLLGLNVPGTGPVVMTSSATDVGSSPSTVRARIGGGQTALRVFTGQTPINEPYFDLYVSKNGAAAVPVRVYRWQGRIFRGNPGDTFAFGTSDGRTLYYAPLTAPANITAPSGVNGTANADKALPILWSPSAAHITLPALAGRFQLNADGTERVVFISEQSPDGTWTPARWVILPAATNVVVQCNYTNIALANEAGAALSVTAPTGSSIGGTSMTMSLPAYSVTGTVHNVTTVAELKTAIAAAVAGDDIVLAAGTYALDVAITNASFTANVAAGRKGMEGIRIRGATSDRTLYILGGNGVGSNGDWSLTLSSSVDMTSYAYLENFTWNFGANNIKVSMGGGKYRCTNVRATGGSAADLWDVNCLSYPMTFWALYCRADTSADDCWNMAGNATYNGVSTCNLISCDGVTAGAAAGSQCLTSHTGMVVAVYGGTYSDANTNVVANDAGTTKLYMFWSTVSAGARAARINNGVSIFGITWTGANLSALDDVRVCNITGGDTLTPLRNSTGPVVANRITTSGVNARAIFNSVASGPIKGNLLTAPEGIRLGNAVGAIASTDILWNTMSGCTTGGWNQIDVSNCPAVHKNNAYRGNTNSIVIPTGGMPVITTNYNTIDPTIDADYTAGANDTTGADAALNTTSWFPTAAGNCDGNGDATAVSYIGDTDIYGFVHIYHAGRASRGTRDNPGVYSGAGLTLYPDYI